MLFTLILLAAGGLRVELLPEAKVRGAELRLDEIARVAGDEALLERARSLRLGYAPAPGHSRRLDRWGVARELEQALPGVAIEVAGAEACRVLPAVERVPAADVLAAARAELERALGGGDVAFEAAGEVHDLEAPAGRLGRTLRARVEPRDVRPGLLTVPVDVVVDGELYSTAWTSWRVDVWRDAAVLACDVRAGERLTPASFRRERVKLELAGAGAALDELSADGAVAARDLRTGSVVQEGDVRRLRLVRRGDTLELRVTKGRVTATAAATAYDDGFLGDKVRVVTAGQRELRAVVLGRGLVAIDLEAR